MAAPAGVSAACLNLQRRVSTIEEVTARLAFFRRIFFKQICEHCGRKNRLAVVNKITAMSDAPKKILSHSWSHQFLSRNPELNDAA